MKKTVLASAMAIVLGNGAAQAGQVYDFAGSFTFYDASGALSSTDTNVSGTFTMPDATNPNGSGQFTTSQLFQGYTWVADVDTMFGYDTNGAATQTFSYSWTNKDFFQSGVGVTSCRTGVVIDGCAGVSGNLLTSVTRGYSFDLTNAGQFGSGVFFDWSVNTDIPVLATLQIINDPTTSGGVLQVVSFDGRVSAINQAASEPAYIGSPDSLPGNRMLVGPFPNQTPAFGGTLTPAPIPVPAAVWLFGSGLLGLVGVARRRKQS